VHQEIRVRGWRLEYPLCQFFSLFPYHQLFPSLLKCIVSLLEKSVCTAGAYPCIHAQGKELKHPERLTNSDPAVFEFAEPIEGTYPIWYDRSYWLEGAIFKFNRDKQLQVFVINSLMYIANFGGILIFASILLFLISRQIPFSPNRLILNYLLLVPALAGFLCYFLGTNLGDPNERRYYFPFVLLLFAGLICSICLKNGFKERLAVASWMGVITTFFLWYLWIESSWDIKQISLSPPPYNWQISKYLHTVGIQSGDRVAQLGFIDQVKPKIVGHFKITIPGYMIYYWAHLAKVKIVADIPDQKRFWSVKRAKRESVMRMLASIGVKAIVISPGSGFTVPSFASEEGWQRIADGDSFIYRLPIKPVNDRHSS